MPDDEEDFSSSFNNAYFNIHGHNISRWKRYRAPIDVFSTASYTPYWALIINIVIKTFFGCRLIWNYATGHHNGDLFAVPWYFLHGNYRLSQRRTCSCFNDYYMLGITCFDGRSVRILKALRRRSESSTASSFSVWMLWHFTYRYHNGDLI